MRVLAVVPSQYDTSPGQRFRIEQWAPHLAAEGIEITFAPFENARLHDALYRPGHAIQKIVEIVGAFGRRVALARHVHDFDAVYLFREAGILGPALIERWLGQSKVPIVFDFDDAVFEPYVSPSNGYLSLLKCPRKTAAICRLATHVIAGNSYLATYARRHNDCVTVVPTTIDTARYTLASRAANPIPVIGWSGSHSTVQHLRIIDGALRRLAYRHAFMLRVIGTPSYDIDDVQHQAMPWNAATEVEDLRPIDIGVMPLPDDRWSRGKCGLKALQYMALGIPTVCSPVGVNAEIIQDGSNGMMADTEDDWVDRLSSLIESESLRRRLGYAGRATVEQWYAANIHIQVIRDLLMTASLLNARTRRALNG